MMEIILKQVKTVLFLTLFLAVAPFYALTAHAHDEDHHSQIEIEDVWARKTGTRSISAAVYLHVSNKGPEADTITSVRTERAEDARMHRTVEEGGIMRMLEQDQIKLAPDTSLSFEPGSYHIMMTNLTSPLVEEEVFPLTLTFEKAGEVTVYVTVTGLNGLSKPSQH